MKYVVKYKNVRIDFEQNEKFAKQYANSFGTENGRPLAIVEKI